MLETAKRHLNQTTWFGLAERRIAGLWLLEATLPALAQRVRNGFKASVPRASADAGDGATDLGWLEVGGPRAAEAMHMLRERNSLDLALFEYATELFERRLAVAVAEAAGSGSNK